MEEILTEDDLKALRRRCRQKRTFSSMRLAVASKTGKNARGKGAGRSVVLGSWDGDVWFQAEKFWGRNNEERAREFVRQWKKSF